MVVQFCQIEFAHLIRNLFGVTSLLRRIRIIACMWQRCTLITFGFTQYLYKDDELKYFLLTYSSNFPWDLKWRLLYGKNLIQESFKISLHWHGCAILPNWVCTSDKESFRCNLTVEEDPHNCLYVTAVHFYYFLKGHVYFVQYKMIGCNTVHQTYTQWETTLIANKIQLEVLSILKGQDFDCWLSYLTMDCLQRQL